MRRGRAPLAVVVAAASLALAGCGLLDASAPTAVQVLVTRDFGSQVLHRSGSLKATGGETVMSLLRGNADVAAVSGGHIVESIDGASGGEEGGEPLDWFYYVNGVEAPRGAGATEVRPGDHVWWDLHDWSQAAKVPAVVGSFPEPFLNGYEGKRLPVRIECAPSAAYACATVTARLRSLGVPAAAAAIGSGGAPETLRLMVGRWDQLEAELARSLQRGPRSSGVYARFSASGSAIAVLDPNGNVVQTLTGAGLIAATRQAEEAPVWVVTGTDGTGLDAAARAFDRATLEDHFAVAIAPGGAAVALPAPDR
ncbi:MAG TPA: DUF4430 domain-containing protein [Solirubrobacteraceae bacterium]|nr:DUF4430 domain-containing protein [Solirubrobacteraceae bacterium]